MANVDEHNMEVEAMYYAIEGDIESLLALKDKGFDLKHRKKEYLCWFYEANNMDGYNKLLQYYNQLC